MIPGRADGFSSHNGMTMPYARDLGQRVSSRIDF
jgi:hypothetical protein